MVGYQIKKLRQALGLTQTEFATRIGMKQNSIALIESGKRNISDSALKFICREFNVNENWLRVGAGEIFKTENEILENPELDEVDKAILRAYISLPPAARKHVREWIKKAADAIRTQEKISDDELTRAEKHALLDAELDAQEKGRTSSVSTFSNGRTKNKV